MSKNKKLTHNEKVIEALKKIKTPIYDKRRNLNIFFKEHARSNETGVEHISKSYHNLDPSDIELLVKGINKPVFHSKDKRYARTYCYYYRRKHDKKNYVKVVVKVEERDFRVGFISTIHIASKLK